MKVETTEGRHFGLLRVKHVGTRRGKKIVKQSSLIYARYPKVHQLGRGGVMSNRINGKSILSTSTKEGRDIYLILG